MVEESEQFDDGVEKATTTPAKVGYNQIVDAVFNPDGYLNRMEMSIMPEGNKAYKMAIVMTRQRVKAAIIKGDDYDVEELLLDSYARVKRGGNKGALLEKAVELKALETERDKQIINQMSGD